MPKGALNMRVDPILTKISLMITNEEFIHDKILPSVPVAQYKGAIAKYGQDHLREFRTQRAIKDMEYNVMEHSVEVPVDYEIKYHDLAEIITDQEYKLYELPFDARQDAIAALAEAKSISLERDLAFQLGDTSLLTNNATPANLWDDYSNSDPLGDMETAAESIRSKTGRRPNNIVTNAVVLSKLKSHPQFLDKLSGIKRDLTSFEILDIIKAHLGVKSILVGSSIYVDSKEGQSVTKTDIWNDDFVLYFVPGSASLRTPSFGYRLTDSKKPQQVKTGRYPTDKGDVIEMSWALEDKILDVDSAYLLDQVIA